MPPVRPSGTSHHLWSLLDRPGGPRRLTLVPARDWAPAPDVPGDRPFVLVELDAWFMTEAVGSEPQLTRFAEQRSDKLDAFLRAMLEAASANATEAVLAGLSAALCRGLAVAAGVPLNRQGDAWINPNALSRVLLLIEDDLAGDLKVDRLAAASGLSASAFLRAFRGSMGTTPGEHITRRRVARAAELVKATDIPIATIARLCGFGTAAHFATTFKVRLGLQPAALRRSVRAATPTLRPTARGMRSQS